MFVSLFSDASHCSKLQVAAWGAWIKSERGRIYGGAPFKNTVANSLAAEMMAVANALTLGINKGIIRSGDTVLIQSDCKEALAFFEKHNRGTRTYDELSRFVRKLSVTHNILLKWKHVKGHVTGGATRNEVNNICDRIARREMRKARTLKTGEINV